MSKKTQEAAASNQEPKKQETPVEEKPQGIPVSEQAQEAPVAEKVLQPLSKDLASAPPPPPPPPDNEPEKPAEDKKFKYPVYDLWKIESTPTDKADKDGNNKVYKYEAIKILRSNVKIEHNVAERLNTQSHNSLRRYYLQGTVTNGDSEEVSVK